MNKEDVAVDNTKHVDELCEDIEVVGPGLMLSEARKKLSLSEEEVSNRLNFRKNLINEIEQDIFDPSLPATFNRGYLRNYAALVGVDVDEVLSAYDMLGVAEIQRSEMQSFSNLTEKEAEHSRLMWISYLIVALLVGMVVLWWVQEPKLTVNLFNKSTSEQATSINTSNITETKTEQENAPPLDSIQIETSKQSEITALIVSEQKTLEATIGEPKVTVDSEEPITIKPMQEAIPALEVVTELESESVQEQLPDISTAVFTFSGDCWVNIYDATGERIAWGVKKSGYVMTVTGKAPLKVTLGKPELATINFNDKPVDLSSFNVGNIAKFTLPLISQ
jgi:cytoskeleton protein RodZ